MDHAVHGAGVRVLPRGAFSAHPGNDHVNLLFRDPSSSASPSAPPRLATVTPPKKQWSQRMIECRKEPQSGALAYMTSPRGTGSCAGSCAPWGKLSTPPASCCDRVVIVLCLCRNHCEAPPSPLLFFGRWFRWTRLPVPQSWPASLSPLSPPFQLQGRDRGAAAQAPRREDHDGVRQLRHHFGPVLTHFSALCRSTRTARRGVPK